MNLISGCFKTLWLPCPAVWQQKPERGQESKRLAEWELCPYSNAADRGVGGGGCQGGVRRQDWVLQRRRNEPDWSQEVTGVWRQEKGNLVGNDANQVRLEISHPLSQPACAGRVGIGVSSLPIRINLFWRLWSWRLTDGPRCKENWNLELRSGMVLFSQFYLKASKRHFNWTHVGVALGVWGGPPRCWPRSRW